MQGLLVRILCLECAVEQGDNLAIDMIGPETGVSTGSRIGTREQRSSLVQVLKLRRTLNQIYMEQRTHVRIRATRCFHDNTSRHGGEQARDLGD